MSRVGKSLVKLPSSVTMTQEGSVLTFKGKLGVQSYTIPENFSIEKASEGIIVTPLSLNKTTRTLWGTTQRNLSNLIKGLDQGFTVNIDLVGVGYRASVAGSKLTLQLGYSHDVVYDLPSGVTVKCEKPTSISVTSPSKQQVGQIVSELGSYRFPEPYKGKGVIREGQYVVRKEGKKK